MIATAICLPTAARITAAGPSGELARRGLERPAIAVITGMRKPWRTAFSERDYQRVRDLDSEHERNYPRRIAT